MLSSNLKHSVAALAVAAGLLAAAAPTSALAHDDSRPSERAQTVTMLDYEGSPVMAPSAPHTSLGRENSIEALSYSWGQNQIPPF